MYQSWQLMYTKCTCTATIHTYQSTDYWSGNKCISHDSCTPNTHVQLPYTLINQLIIDRATNLSVMTVDIHQMHRYSYHTHLHQAYWVMTADIHQMHKAQIPYTLTLSIPRQLIYTKCTGTNTIHTYTEHTETVDIHKMHKAQIPYTLTPSIPRQLIYTKCTGTDTIHTYTEHTETVDIHKMPRHSYHTHLHQAYWAINRPVNWTINWSVLQGLPPDIQSKPHQHWATS